MSFAVAWRWGRLVLLAVVLAWLVLGALAWIFQRRLIYMPGMSSVDLPTGRDGEGLTQVYIETADGIVLQAWLLEGKRPGTVLWLHGNAGDRGDRIGVVREFRRRGWGLLLPDYRGYGGNEGSPSEEGFRADAEACRAWLLANVPGPIVYAGSSIGSGVAVDLAARAAPAGLLLLSPFTSLVDAAKEHYPWLPVGPFLRDRYENIDKIGDVRCPLLVIHGGRDRIVPRDLGRALFDAANEPKTWVEIAGAGHNDLDVVDPTTYWDAVDVFLRRCLTP